MAMGTTLPRSATEVAHGDGAAHGPFEGVYTRHLLAPLWCIPA
jgi:hypothetical protein